MAFVRTRSGTQRLDHLGREYIVTENGIEIPDDLAPTVRGHVNLDFGDLDPRTGTPLAPAVESPEITRPLIAGIESPSVDTQGRPTQPVKPKPAPPTPKQPPPKLPEPPKAPFKP